MNLKEIKKNLIPYGFKVFSQTDEDGIINEIFKRIGINDKFSHYVGNHDFQRDMMGLLRKPSLTFIHKK